MCYFCRSNSKIFKSLLLTCQFRSSMNWIFSHHQKTSSNIMEVVGTMDLSSTKSTPTTKWGIWSNWVGFLDDEIRSLDKRRLWFTESTKCWLLNVILKSARILDYHLDDSQTSCVNKVQKKVWFPWRWIKSRNSILNSARQPETIP